MITKNIRKNSTNEIQTVVQNAIESCDALYIPTDNTMASNTDIVKNLVIPAKNSGNRRRAGNLRRMRNRNTVHQLL